MSAINFGISRHKIDTPCAFCGVSIQGYSEDFECINDKEEYSKYCTDPLYNYYKVKCSKCNKSFGTSVLKGDDKPVLNFWKGN